MVAPAASHGRWHTHSASVMGTQASLTFWHTDDKTASLVIQAVFDEFRRIDHTYSPYKASSLLSHVNRQASHRPQVIDEEFVRLVDKSLYFSRMTEGAFDVTYASLGWRYDYRQGQQPSETERLALLPAINFRWVALDPQSATIKFLHANVRIDLGGVAKGYAVDQAVRILKRLGVTNASVSAGGDSRLLGAKRGKPWIVGIKHPRSEKADEAVIHLPLTDTAISTSGDYERYFIDAQSGERVHHIINPKTGRPTETVSSVTILGPQGFDTDPMSTSVFVMGIKKGLALVNRLEGFDAIIIDRQGKVFYSDGLIEPH